MGACCSDDDQPQNAIKIVKLSSDWSKDTKLPVHSDVSTGRLKSHDGS